MERYLEHFAECSVSQLPDDFPNFLRVDVSVDIIILLFLLIGPQLKNLAKIEERHLSGRERAVERVSSWWFPPRKYSGSSRAQMAN